MKTLLIDPSQRTITVFDLKANSEGSTLENLYQILDCNMVEVPVRFPNGDGMYCDEESWLHVSPKDTLSGFMFPDWVYPILGKALIVGTGDEGEDTNCNTNVASLFKIVWLDDKQMREWGGVMETI